MLIGMVLIIAGLIASLYGLYPRSAEVTAGLVSQIQVRAMDEVPLRAAHIGLLVVMAIAVTIDVMKPTTLAFVVPGMALEYGLRSPLNPAGEVPVAYLPLSGISGTVVGSFLWGWLGDRIGRRASILYAGIIFIGSSICGSMPNYSWNFLMCFIMGLGAGGMLPIAYALLAETIPARHRGWLMVVIGGDIAGAYIITSWLASELVPQFSWRILWLLGAPTGVLLILLNRWIPGVAPLSPCQRTARRGACGDGSVRGPDRRRPIRARDRDGRQGPVDAAVPRAAPEPKPRHIAARHRRGAGTVRLQPMDTLQPEKAGLRRSDGRSHPAGSALIGFPFTFLVAWMYGFWSSKKTIILLTALTASALLGFAIMGDSVAKNRTLLYALLVIPIWGINSVTAVLTVYSSEIYPTRIRSRGTGLAAGASKAGGVMIITLVVLGVAAPSLAGTTLVGGIPMALAAVAILLFGVETRNRRLEQITAAAFRPGLSN